MKPKKGAHVGNNGPRNRRKGPQLPMLYFFLLFYVAAAYWRDDASTGYHWSVQPADATSCANTGYSPNQCCSTKQEPFTARADLTEKLNVALFNYEDNYVRTFLPNTLRNQLCPSWDGNFYAYTDQEYVGQIGSATIRWGGLSASSAGTCLVFRIQLDSGKLFSSWHVRVGASSLNVEFNSFPPFTGTEWHTNTFATPQSFAEFEICPTNPNTPASFGYTPGPPNAEWPLPGCYQASWIAVHLGGLTSPLTDAWLVPNQETTPIPSSTSLCESLTTISRTSTSQLGQCGCRHCAGVSSCCADPQSPLYGICQNSAATNCPTHFACSGGNCPDLIVDGFPEISCVPTDPDCFANGNLDQFCWGKLACHPTRGCPEGFIQDMFCFTNGKSGGVKVCCSVGTSYVDFSATSTPTCADYCWSMRYDMVSSTSSTTPMGTLRAGINGDSLQLSYDSVGLGTIIGAKVWIGKPETFTSSWVWTYLSGGAFIDTPYHPIPTFEGNSVLSVHYDLLRAIGSENGPIIACNENFQFVFEATVALAAGGTATAVFPATSIFRDDPRLPMPLVSVGGRFVAPAVRCCYPGTTTGDQCAPDAPCAPTNKFMDNFRWTAPGIEFETERCCPHEEILDNILPYLPENVKNTALTIGPLKAQCVSGTCSMSWMFLYEGTSTHNNLGYFILNANGVGVDTTKLSSGYGYVFPDGASLHSEGCLTAGDTMQVSVPTGASVGWYVRNSDKNRLDGGANIRTSLDTTNRFGMFSFGGGIILAVEDGATGTTGGDDFNDALIGIRLLGDWQLSGGTLTTDRCTGTILSCATFAPYDYADYVFKPDCRAHITLDIGVGSYDPAQKDPVNYYAIPVGWDIAPVDALFREAVAAYGDTWASPCFVGRDPNNLSSFIGILSDGTPCSGFLSSWVKTQPNPDGSVTSCYSVGTLGHLVLRENQADPFCFVDNYGEYCDPATSTVIQQQDLAAEPSSVWLNLLSGVSAQVPFYIPMNYNLQTYVLIDTYKTINTFTNDPFASIHRTLPYLFASSYAPNAVTQKNTVIGAGWKGQFVNLGYTISTGGYSKACVWTSNPSAILKTSSTGDGCVEINVAATTTPNIFTALTTLLTEDQAMFDWRRETPRYVYVPTQDPFTSYGSEPHLTNLNKFKAAMQNAGIFVVFLPAVSSATTNLANLLTGVPRVAISSVIQWPDVKSGASTNAISTAAWGWQGPAGTARKTLDGTLTFKKLAVTNYVDTPQFFTLNSGPFKIVDFGTETYPLFQYYTIPNAVTATLPAGYPGLDTWDEVPHAVKWEVQEILTSTYGRYSFTTYAFWNEPPRLWQNGADIVYTFSDQTPGPYDVQLLDKIISSVDPNYNKLDVVFTSSSFAPSVPSGGFVQSAVGYGRKDGDIIAQWSDASLSTVVNLNDPTTGQPIRYPIIGFTVTPTATGYGTWTLKYKLFDGCLYSPEGTIVINYVRTKVNPTCKDSSIALAAGSGTHPVVDFSTLITETPMSCNPVAPATVGSCPEGAFAVGTCTKCYPGTSCCSEGTAAGTCGASPAVQCPSPAASSYLCSGYTCPTQLTPPPSATVPGLIKCNAFKPATCVGTALCFGSTECTGYGCPSGLQDGLFCTFRADAPLSISVCCSQLTSNLMKIAIDTNNAAYGPVRFPLGGTYSPITYGLLSAAYNPLQFQYTGSVVADTTFTWNYRATAALTGREVSGCRVTITVSAPNDPPTITATQTITTPTNPVTVGTWTVTICDKNKPAGDTLTLYFDEPSINVNTLNANLPLITQVTGDAVYPSPSTATYTTVAGQQDLVLFQDYALTNAPASGTTYCYALLMQWSPLATHSFTTPDVFKLYVKDSKGLTSAPITITLKVPANEPPIFLGTSPDPHRIDDPDFAVIITGSDPNLIHTETLKFTITAIPDVNIYGQLKYNGAPVVLGATYTINNLPAGYTDNNSDGITTYPFTFDPANNQITPAGGVPVQGYFTDAAGLTGSGQINIVLTAARIPPTSIDETKEVILGAETALDPHNAWSAEMPPSAAGIEILSIFNQFPTAQFRWNGVQLVVGQKIEALTPGTNLEFSSFSYYTEQTEEVQDFFTFRAYDTRTGTFPNLVSAVHVSRVHAVGTPPPVNLPPTAEPGAVVTPYNTPVTIPLVWDPTGTTPISFTDPDNLNSDVLVTITTLPPATAGVLLSDGVLVKSGDIVNPEQLVFRPLDGFVGDVPFTFTVTDPLGLSDFADVTITVQPQPVPPTIVITPSTLEVPRTSTGWYTVTVTDSDSTDVKVAFTSDTVPFGPDAGNVWSTFELYKCTDATCICQASNTCTLVKAYDFTTQPDTTTILTVKATDVTPLDTTGEWSFVFAWKPTTIIPDDTTGSFSLIATDPTNLISNIATATMTVPLNIKPVIQLPPSGPPYEQTIPNTQTSVPVVLHAEDADPWDADNLVFTVTELPPTGFLSTTPDCLTPITTVPAVVDTTSSVPDVSSTSDALTYCPPSGVTTETVTFQFTATDILGKVSDPQTVTITFTEVEDPPVTSDVTLYVYQDSKVKDFNPLPSLFARLTGSDPDAGQTATLKLFFESTPDVSTKGTLYYNDPDVSVDTVNAEVIVSGGLSAAFDSSIDWKFYFEPLPGQHSEGCDDLVVAKCLPYAVANFYVEDTTGRISNKAQLTIYVIPVNTPPSCSSLTFRTPMNTPLVVSYTDFTGFHQQLPAADYDNVNADLGARALDIHPDNEGVWTTNTNEVIPEEIESTNPMNLPERYLKYTPPTNAYSIPENVALGHIFFDVFDKQPLYSVNYCTVKVFVDYVPPQCVWTGPRVVVAREDTDLKINVASESNYENPLGSAVLFTLLTGPSGTDKGYFFTCATTCTPIDFSMGSFVMPSDGFFYRPPADANGEKFTSFDFKLELLDPQGKPHPESTCLITVDIDVTPVNDPPTLIPKVPSHPPSVPQQSPLTPFSWAGECDENTDTFPDSVSYFRLRFSATDIDNPLGELRAQTVTLIETEKCSLYTCGPEHQEGGSGDYQCRDGKPITGIEFVTPLAPGEWEISFVPAPHWNYNFGGLLNLGIVIWDNELFTPVRTFKLRVWPINDYPTIVEGTTSVLIEVWEENIKTGVLTRLSKDGGEAGFEIRIPEQYSEEREDVVPGKVLETSAGRKPVESPVNENSEEAPEQSNSEKDPENFREVNVYRLRTELQDAWDFTFGLPLNLTGSLIRAAWAVEIADEEAAAAKRQSATANYASFIGPQDGSRRDFTVNVYAPGPPEANGVVSLNSFLKVSGLPFFLDADENGKEVTSALGVFLIDDMGNVDKKNRPLAGGFTIEIIRPADDEELAVPIAAVVILPVIAAASAAAIAAAWILLGQRAQEYASASFDAFAVTAANSGTKSPLYDDQGREVVSPLYSGRPEMS